MNNFFKIALRTLLKNKLYATINISGLALGLTCIALILLYVRYELSYDKFHSDYDTIYRITWEDDNAQTRTPHPMAQALVTDFPEVEAAVSLSPLWSAGLTRRTFSIRNPEQDIRHDETAVLAVDSTFFDVFSFELIKGNPKTVLRAPDGILISESAARKYFADEDPIGKYLAVNNDSSLIQVTGVFKDVPRNSHFHFDFLISYVLEKLMEDPESEYYTWSDFGHYNYIRLKPGTNAQALEDKLLAWAAKFIKPTDEVIQAIQAAGYGFRLQPITDIHLKSRLRWELESNGNINYVYMMSGAAVLLLIIAAVNVMNITTSLSMQRAREIGVKKTLGAFTKTIGLQFFYETLLMAVIALLIAILLIDITLPVFNGITGYSFTTADVFATSQIILLVAIVTGIAAFASFYPALVMASIKPGQILKGNFSTGRRGVVLRHSLIVFQFFISMILISGSIVIYNQIHFLKHKAIGFDREQVLVIPVKDRELYTKFDALRNELLTIQGITHVTSSSNLPGKQFNVNPVFALKDPMIRVASYEILVDYDFLKTLNIQLYEGRFFDRNNAADLTDAYVINETLARNLFGKNAIGEMISWERDGQTYNGKVIGIVSDFHFQSLHQEVGPLLMKLSPRMNYALIKITPNSFTKQVKQIEKTWKQFDDTFNFEFYFMDENLQQQYAMEEKMGLVVSGFSLIAIVIACFGLFGLATISFVQRTKEVGIRKVLGAPVISVMILLMHDFTRLVIIAIVIAVPFSWWLMTEWLSNFSFKVSISPWWFVFTGVGLLAISWLTIMQLTIGTARQNPVETLRSE